jgi:hypothetical protein
LSLLLRLTKISACGVCLRTWGNVTVVLIMLRNIGPWPLQVGKLCLSQVEKSLI